MQATALRPSCLWMPTQMSRECRCQPWGSGPLETTTALRLRCWRQRARFPRAAGATRSCSPPHTGRPGMSLRKWPAYCWISSSRTSLDPDSASSEQASSPGAALLYRPARAALRSFCNASQHGGRSVQSLIKTARRMSRALY